jgi:protein-tyrosine-phosphatase
MNSSAPKTTRVLMVCLGNLCRSPTAEAVLRKKVHEAGLDGRIEVDSAGTRRSAGSVRRISRINA